MKLLKYTTLLTLLLLFSLRLSRCQEQEAFIEATQEYNTGEQIEEAPLEAIIEEEEEEEQQEENPEEATIEEEESEECPQYMEETEVNGYPMIFYPCCVSSSAQCDDNPVPVCLQQLNCEGSSCTTEYVTVANECQACKGHNNLQFARGECPWESEEEDEELMCPEYIEETTVKGIPMTFYPCCVSSKEQCDDKYSPVCLENMTCEGENCTMGYDTVVNVCNACKGHNNLQYSKGECPWQITNDEKDCHKFIEETEVDGYWMTFHPCCVSSNAECDDSVEPVCIEEVRCEGGHCRRHYETVENVCNACKGHRDWMYSRGKCPWEVNGDRDHRRRGGHRGGHHHNNHWNRTETNENGNGNFLN